MNFEGYLKSLSGRELLIATKHGKQNVIAPAFQTNFNVKCFCPNDYDTDTFGTFSGEIERINGPLDTLRRKCIHAMETYACDLGIASEGSFGPHPAVYFVPSDTEHLIFIDSKNQIEIVASLVSTSTNYATSTIESFEELIDFTKKIGFPSHAIILRDTLKKKETIIKGITDENMLKVSFEKLKGSTLLVETDMRAHLNPTRMKVIEELTGKLIDKLKSNCPSCFYPGYTVKERIPGLPCSQCGLPTRSTKSNEFKCEKCKCKTEQLFPNGKKEEDPMYCDYCNP